jgi:two-component system, OmpR family, response regulator
VIIYFEYVERLRKNLYIRKMNVRLKTYLVEDNPTILENLIATLEELANVDVVGTANTESEGKAWLLSHPHQWDLAILDLFLKEGSGLGVLGACRDRKPEQSVVVLSNYATHEIRQRCANLGANAVFDKSNEIDALVDFCLAQSAA